MHWTTEYIERACRGPMALITRHSGNPMSEDPYDSSANSGSLQAIYKSQDVVQVNIPAESGEMGVLANHVPSIEQLKPGLIEVIEESGGSKQFFRMSAGNFEIEHRRG
jgi:ATP synthase, Delta/Epsilon chain, beta-sandwich domain